MFDGHSIMLLAKVSLFSGNDEERLKEMVLILCLIWCLVSIFPDD